MQTAYLPWRHVPSNIRYIDCSSITWHVLELYLLKKVLSGVYWICLVLTACLMYYCLISVTPSLSLNNLATLLPTMFCTLV